METFVGAVGTTLLVLAFILNVTGRLRVSFMYSYMNLFGAALAAAASFMIDFLPFVILEAVWFLAAGAKLFDLYRHPEHQSAGRGDTAKGNVTSL